MDWQQIASLAVVAVTAVLLTRHKLHRRGRARLKLCGNDCGCSSESGKQRDYS